MVKVEWLWSNIFTAGVRQEMNSSVQIRCNVLLTFYSTQPLPCTHRLYHIIIMSLDPDVVHLFLDSKPWNLDFCPVLHGPQVNCISGIVYPPSQVSSAVNHILMNTFVLYFHKERMISGIVVFKSLLCWIVFPEEHFMELWICGSLQSFSFGKLSLPPTGRSRGWDPSNVP